MVEKVDDALIARIHDSEASAVLAVTGGGTSAVSRLLAVPGASRTILNAVVPYAGSALTAYLGHEVEQSCSSKAARELAMRAWQEAMTLAPGQTVLGVGCTAAFATDRERRGLDRAFIAVQGLAATHEVEVVFNKAHHTRGSEENGTADLLIALLARASGLNIQLPQTEHAEVIEHTAIATRSWQALISGEQALTSTSEPPKVVFPGAFNPMHHGHVEMATYAENLLGHAVTLEVSVTNVDKPPIDYLEMSRRESAIAHEFELVFTRAPTFVEKAKLFPGACFIVGADTITRIAEPRYYGDSIEQRDTALASFADADISFLVFGRQQGDDFLSLDNVTLPEVLRKRCQGVSEEAYRQDVSSTDIRTSLG